MLVVAGVAHHDRAHQCGIVGEDIGLHRAGQRQIVPPAWVRRAAAVRADDKFDLRGGGLLGAEDLALVPVAVLDGVAVNVENVEQGGVLPPVFLDGGEGTVVRAGIAGVVVERAVVEHAEPRVAEHLCDLVAHAHHVAGHIQRAVVVGGDILLPGGHGVGLAAVGVDDEHLRPVLRHLCREIQRQLGRIQRRSRGVVDEYVPQHHVARRVGGAQRAGGHAVVRGGDAGPLGVRMGQDGALVLLRVLRGVGGKLQLIGPGLGRVAR